MVKTEKVEVNYGLSNLQYVFYEKIKGDNILRIRRNGENVFGFDGERLVFPASCQKNVIGIYSMDGRRIICHEQKERQTLEISLQDFPKGVYVVKVKGLTYKVLKK